MKDFLPPLTLVLGGAASGKSVYAESLIARSQRAKGYIATAQAFDTEMTDKIRLHQESRGPDWTTIEAPTDLVGALAKCTSDQAVLIDCATLWLTNLILSDANVADESMALLAALTRTPYPVVIVSNEVGQGIVPENALSRQFRNAQGQLNQQLAAHADTVVAVMAGLPFALKGEML